MLCFFLHWLVQDVALLFVVFLSILSVRVRVRDSTVPVCVGVVLALISCLCWRAPCLACRVYSPVAFGKKTDPSGAYIRKYIPQLRAFPDK